MHVPKGVLVDHWPTKNKMANCEHKPDCYPTESPSCRIAD